MFRQRTSSQKPNDDLLADFRQQFPEVIPVTSETTAPPVSQAADTGNALAPTQNSQLAVTAALGDQDPTPRASNEPWRFTPSLLDPNTFSFNTYANAPHGFYAQTPGVQNTLFHPQAGDLHTPTLALHHGLGTPMSMPGADGSIPGLDMSAFQPMNAHHFNQFSPFMQAPAQHNQQQQQSFAPSTFMHQDTGYETMEHDGSPVDSDPSEEKMGSIAAAFQKQQSKAMRASQSPLPVSAEKFRYHSVLNAPTAMIKHADEIPVTYLNKGQAYSLSISDTKITKPIAPGTKFRTFIRISFEEDEQRQKPGVCWSLWKEGRGTNEAHQRGGKLQAVEFVEAGQPAGHDNQKTRVELETSSFDGFSVIWTPGTNGTPEVNIAVRFNFLSTDFSHSKGVKGIPVRLCAKTNVVSSGSLSPTVDTSPEICFGKVKLFRDHGAERKLSNDVAHVKKSMDKLKQQIAQAESGLKDFSKRKRASGISKALETQRPGKAQKHKRTWSMSSTSSAGGGGGRTTLEEDLQVKLQTLQDMFSSTRPVSVLYLRGEGLDDPDLHPVSLQGASPLPKGAGQAENPNWQARSGHTSDAASFISPSPSSLSLASQASGTHWQNFDSTVSGDTLRKRPTKIKTDDDGSLSGWIEALGVDPSYRPPPDRAQKPVACFYIQYKKTDVDQSEYHRAVYLTQRSLQNLNERIAQKWGFDVSRIRRTIHVVQGSLEIEIDDDVVQELKEGQPMSLEVEEAGEAQPQAKREWDMSVDDGESDAKETETAGGLVLRLTF